MIKKYGILLSFSSLVFGFCDGVSGKDHTLPSVITLSSQERDKLLTKLRLENQALDDVVSVYVMINTQQALTIKEDGSPVRPTSGENLIRTILPNLSSSLDVEVQT